MAIRHIFAAALMASACVAQAGTISSGSSSTSAFLSGWTTGNGTSVLGSGVLSNNLNLIGGVSYGAGAAASDALLSQASSTLGAGGSTQLFYTKGIEGMYLLGSGHGILAAMLGNGVSVVGSNGGVTVGAGASGSVAGTIGTGSIGSTGSDTGLRAPANLPEPSSIALVLLGMAGVGTMTRRRRAR